MPSYDFQCRKCKAFSLLVLGPNEQYGIVKCPDCGSQSMEVVAFDSFDSPAIRETLFEKLSRLEKRLADLEVEVFSDPKPSFN